MPYRTGRHWGVTIVREGTEPIEMGKRPDDQLVAVVTNGDTALAERICADLNGEALAQATTRDLLGELLHRADLDDDEDGPAMLARLRPLLELSDEALDARRADYVPNDPAIEHRAEHPGSDGLGYGRCAGCGEMWPCMASRGVKP